MVLVTTLDAKGPEGRQTLLWVAEGSLIFVISNAKTLEVETAKDRVGGHQCKLVGTQ